jgi:multidrug efflux system membrane fusion protein
MTQPMLPEPTPSAPQRSSSSSRWVLGIAALLLTAFAVWFVRFRKPATPPAGPDANADRVVPVLVATVTQRDVPIYLEGLGNVTPIAMVAVKSQVDGRLDTVAFKEGQKVKKGDLIAQVDPRPFMIQLHTAEAASARDVATWQNAKLNLDRYKTLRQQNLIPQQQVDDQQTLFDQTAAALMADQAQVDTAKLLLDYARIVSPIDGVTGVRLVDPGNLVHAADQTGIVVVTQIDPIAVVFTLPEDDLARVAEQLSKGAITVDAYNRDGAKKIASGELKLIDNQINTTTATIRLKASFENPNGVLWPNEFVKARMLLSTKKDAIVIPSTVVQRGPQGTFAYVIGEDKTVTMRPIEIELTEGELTIVSKGLEVGEQVAADGQNQLRPGAKVSPRDKGFAPPASAHAGAGAGAGAGASARASAAPLEKSP